MERAMGIEPTSEAWEDRKSTRLNSSHGYISYAVFCLKKIHRHSDVVNQTVTQSPLVYVVGQLNYVRASDLIECHSVIAECDRQHVECTLVGVVRFFGE